MRLSVVIAFLAVALAGRGGTNSPSDLATQRVDRCADRLLSRADLNQEVTTEAARRYVKRAYCLRFDKRGWIDEDGALSIAAAEGSEMCAVARPHAAAVAVPCEDLEQAGSPRVLDCALLHHVRRSEVQAYVRQLQNRYSVECDDGTRLDELGVR